MGSGWLCGRGTGLKSRIPRACPHHLVVPLMLPFPPEYGVWGGGSPLATGTLSPSSCLAVFLDNLLDQGVLELPWEQG